LRNKVFLILLITIPAIIAGLPVFYYLDTFPGDFSVVQAHWGSFGSYFGGIVSPILSLLSLFAVVLTVTLQKKLLDAQRSDFSALNKLQIESNKQLGEQITIQFEQSERDSFDRKKSELLNIIQSRIEQFILSEKLKIRAAECEISITETDGKVRKLSTNEIDMSILKIKTELLAALTKIHVETNAHHNVSIKVSGYKRSYENNIESYFYEEMTKIRSA